LEDPFRFPTSVRDRTKIFKKGHALDEAAALLDRLA
jgi:hypothetical protein